MKTISTPRLRKLERLLLDADVHVKLADYLRAVGFDVELAIRTDANVSNDTDLLKWARENGYILVCHDQHRDANTKASLFPELNSNGGRILRLMGGPDQDLVHLLGKILYRRKSWAKFFGNSSGIFTISETKAEGELASDLFLRVQPAFAGIDPARGVKGRTRQPQRPRRKRQTLLPSQQQPRLLNDENALSSG